MSKTKLPVGKLKSSPTSNFNNGVKFLKTIAPSIRRRRQCDKEKLEIYNLDSNNENFNVWDAIPASPITPPAAFLPPGYKRSGEFLRKILDFYRKFKSVITFTSPLPPSLRKLHSVSGFCGSVGGWRYSSIVKMQMGCKWR